MIELLKRRRDDNGSLCYHFFQCSIRCPNIFSIFIHNHSSFVHILPFNLHKIMFIFWMSNVFLILPWYLFFRQCCLLSGILAESSVYFRRKNYSGLREYSAYIFVEVVVYVFPPPGATPRKQTAVPSESVHSRGWRPGLCSDVVTGPSGHVSPRVPAWNGSIQW